MSTLAIHGGNPVRTKAFPFYNTIGKEEKEAVTRVLDSGILSNFLGCWHPDFFGGPEIQALEKEWAAKFKVKHAMAVNSATSGLMCAIGAVGISPGDEVIVSPYSMVASATVPLIFGGIPVFADVEPDHYCIDPKSVEAKITSRTKAILAVDIFGESYDRDAIRAIAKKHNLFVIEDAAQAIGATYRGAYAGTLGDVGVYSLNYHKHIHSGEGGIVVTDNDELAERVQLLRNHADAVVDGKGVKNIVNMVGFNLRMTEVEAAIARAQLKKLPAVLPGRVESALYLREKLVGIPAISGGLAREGATHSYYVLPLRWDSKVAGVAGRKFIEAVRAELPGFEKREQEGPLLGLGYVRPIYREPTFRNKIAFGKEGYPFSLAPHVSYEGELCPVTEHLHKDGLITTQMIGHHLSRQDLDDVVTAFYKVWEQRATLK